MPPVLHLLSDIFFFFNDTAPTEIYTLSLHDALPIFRPADRRVAGHHRPVHAAQHQLRRLRQRDRPRPRSEEHTSELQSLRHLVCRLLLEKKKKNQIPYMRDTETIQISS